MAAVQSFVGIESRKPIELKLLLYVLFFVLLNTLLLVIFYTGDGSMNAIVVQSSTSYLYNYISCRLENVQFQGIMIAFIVIINYLFTLVALVFSLYTRKIKGDYKENQWISLALFDQVAVILLLLIIYYSGDDSTGSAGRSYVIRSLGAVFVMSVTTLLLFGPKVYHLRVKSNVD